MVLQLHLHEGIYTFPLWFRVTKHFVCKKRNTIPCAQYLHKFFKTDLLCCKIRLICWCCIAGFHFQMGYTDRREVKQFQYIAWPDHGVPEHPAPFLQFLRRISAINTPDAGPVITHCSAGVGRTGAFIVIDSMLERLKHEETVDIYGHVTCLRSQRNYMVQV